MKNKLFLLRVWIRPSQGKRLQDLFEHIVLFLASLLAHYRLEQDLSP
jgi:hypothetical protein